MYLNWTWAVRHTQPARRALRFGFSALALLFLMADDGISSDEFQCEVAVVHLTDCCPGLPASLLSCVHGGCDSQTLPDLTPERASCIKQKSCEELNALAACDMNTWEAAPPPTCAPPCMTKVPPCH